MKPRTKSVNEGVLAAIGQTPLIGLEKLFHGARFRLFAKLESLNPGGSMKDRTSARILQRAMETGEVTARTVIVESSSGNMGVGLAQSCAYYGLRFICVVDPKTTAQNVRLLEAYGAEVDLVHRPDPRTGEYLQVRLDRVRSLCESIPDSFWPNQYANVYAPLAHHQTMREIAVALEDQVDVLFCAVSTCGTLRGCAEYIREHKLPTIVVAVDAIGSVIFGAAQCKRLIAGHGASVAPPLLQPGLAQRYVHVSDLDCVVGCRWLARKEAILAGGSSGAVIAAVDQSRSSIPAGSNCVAILADRGERYLDTIFSDAWVRRNFGEVEHLWDGATAIPETLAAAAVGDSQY
jgi:cysteine synthase A